MADRLLSFLGIARKSGKLVLGNDPAVESASEGKAEVLLTAEDISQNTLEKLRRSAENLNIEIITLNRTKEEISYAVGKNTAVIAVEDKGIARKIIELNSI